VHTDFPVSQKSFETVPQAGGDLPRSEAVIELDTLGGVGVVLRFGAGDEPTEEASAAQAQDRDEASQLWDRGH